MAIGMNLSGVFDPVDNFLPGITVAFTDLMDAGTFLCGMQVSLGVADIGYYRDIKLLQKALQSAQGLGVDLDAVGNDADANLLAPGMADQK